MRNITLNYGAIAAALALLLLWGVWALVHGLVVTWGVSERKSRHVAE